MKMAKLVAAVLALSFAPTKCVFAATYTDSLVRCLERSTTGKDRKDLGRWIVSLMALHPDVASIAQVTKSNRDMTTKTAGLIYRRLLTQDCKKEVKDIVEHEGSDALKPGLDTLGKLAIQEIMSDPNVIKGASEVGKYINKPGSD